MAQDPDTIVLVCSVCEQLVEPPKDQWYMDWVQGFQWQHRECGPQAHPMYQRVTDAPEFDACEDCMGTGGQRDEYGEGTCGACAGRGRLPANAAATRQIERAERDRRLAFERMAEREDREERGFYDDEPDEQEE